MHHEQIKAEIRMRGVTPTQLAEHLEVSPTVVGKVIKGETRSLRIATAIATLIERSLEELWPGAYTDRAPAPTVSQLLKGQRFVAVKQVRRAA